MTTARPCSSCRLPTTTTATQSAGAAAPPPRCARWSRPRRPRASAACSSTSSTADVSDPPHWLHAGRVGRPHGLDGSFHVTRPNAQLLREAAHVMVDDRELEITRRAGTDRSPILRLAGHDDRGAAEALRGKDLMVAREQ